MRLRTLPVANACELVEVRIANGNPAGLGITANAFTDFTVPMWREIKEHHDPLSGIFAWCAGPAPLGPPGNSYQGNAMEVSGDFFNVLGVTPVQGRLIEPRDEAACQTSGVVVSYPFWKSHMGGEPITLKSTDRYRRATSAGGWRDIAVLLRAWSSATASMLRTLLAETPIGTPKILYTP